MGFRIERLVSPYDPLERLTVGEPLSSKRDGTRSAVLLHHAAGVTDNDAWQGRTNPGLYHLSCAIAQDNPSVSPLCRSELNWGTDLSIEKTGEAYQYATEYLGARRGKVTVFGASGGFQAATAWARQNVDLVGLIIGVIPLCDLNDLHANNRGGTAASIDAAYGGAYVEATHGPTHNPARFAGELAGIPVRLFYSGVDPLVIPQTVLDFTEAVGESARAVDIDPDGVGHDLVLGARVSRPWLRRLLAAWGN